MLMKFEIVQYNIVNEETQQQLINLLPQPNLKANTLPSSSWNPR